MNRIEGLINQYCPNGVEYKPLWSITSWDKKFNGVDKSKQKNVIKYNVLLAKDLFALEQPEGDVFLLSTGEQVGWTTEAIAGHNVSEGEVVTIPWGKSRRVVDCVKYYKGKFVTGDNRIATSSDTSLLNNKYLYYCILSNGDIIDGFYRGSGIQHPDMSSVLDLEIPVPPLPVQDEIARILDKFTDLEQELKQDLKQELGLLKKQYEFYRDKILLSAKDIEWIPIGELGEIIRGKRFVHKDDSLEGVPAIHYGELYTYYGISADKTKTHIRSELKSKMRYAHHGDVVIVGAGENKTDIGVGVAWMGDESIAVHDACFILTNHNQNPKYISYCLRTKDYHKKLFPYISEGKICSFLKDGLAQVSIPIPKNRHEQDKIVELLDKLDDLTIKLSEILPTEIMLRHQQCDYYRDKMLSFESKTGE